MNVPPVYEVFQGQKPDEAYSIFEFASCLRIFESPFHALLWGDIVGLLGNIVQGSECFDRQPIVLCQVYHIVLATKKLELLDITLVG
jgi:hypothetical protein